MSSLLRLESRPVSRPAPRFNPALRHAVLFLLTALYLAAPAHAATPADEASPEFLAQLELRASQADPREQCYLYTQLVHSMTQKAGKEISDGDDEKAAATLKQINHFAHLIHVNLARDTKRLKDAEMLMHTTTYHLGQFLHLVSPEDKVTVQDTLKQLNQVNDEILTQVFTH
jgi:hypothetical protein